MIGCTASASGTDCWIPPRKDSDEHCIQRQVQSLPWIIEEAAQSRVALYMIYIDFENAFNSVDHAAVWRWLAELIVPDIVLLRSLYKGAHYEADLPYGRSNPGVSH